MTPAPWAFCGEAFLPGLVYRLAQALAKPSSEPENAFSFSLQVNQAAPLRILHGNWESLCSTALTVGQALINSGALDLPFTALQRTACQVLHHPSPDQILNHGCSRPAVHRQFRIGSDSRPLSRCGGKGGRLLYKPIPTSSGFADVRLSKIWVADSCRCLNGSGDNSNGGTNWVKFEIPSDAQRGLCPHGRGCCQPARLELDELEDIKVAVSEAVSIPSSATSWASIVG